MSNTPLFVREGHAEKWRPWFAWHPVWIDNGEWPHSLEKRVWFRTVLRRRFHAAGWFLDGNISWWQYAALTGEKTE